MVMGIVFLESLAIMEFVKNEAAIDDRIHLPRLLNRDISHSGRLHQQKILCAEPGFLRWGVLIVNACGAEAESLFIELLKMADAKLKASEMR